jgi:alkylation response protein AidB-like acyl-CoA dehydrogenase
LIDLVPDDIQIEIQRVARDAASKLTLRSSVAIGAAEWRTLGDIGIFASGLAEKSGGAGCGARAEVLVAEAFGRCVAPVGILGSILAAHVLAEEHEKGHDELLADIVAGGVRVGLGFRHDAGMRAVDQAGSGLLAVVDSGGVQLVEVRSDVDVVPRSSIDVGATISDVKGDVRIVASTTAPAIVARATLLPAAMAAGVSAAAAERAVEYAKVRQQYGKPIGSFQAIKHRCVDMALRTEAATSLVRLTASRLDAGDVDLAAVSAAHVIASEAARVNASSAVQVFGGIGFTAEGGLQHFIHRAWLLELLGGSTAHHLEILVHGHRER